MSYTNYLQTLSVEQLDQEFQTYTDVSPATLVKRRQAAAAVLAELPVGHAMLEESDLFCLPARSEINQLTVSVPEDNPETAVIGYVSVWEPLQRLGIGSRLYRAAAVHLAQRGVKYIESYAFNNNALRTRQRVFGEEAMHFSYAEDPTKHKLGISTGQLINLNTLIERINKRQLAVGEKATTILLHSVIDLTAVDTSTWELAAEASLPPSYTRASE